MCRCDSEKRGESVFYMKCESSDQLRERGEERMWKFGKVYEICPLVLRKIIHYTCYRQ